MKDDQAWLAKSPRRTKCRLVAIVGGSGAGKTWLADAIQKEVGEGVTRLSEDNFYLDRSDLPSALRERVNYDHPRALDWPCLERALQACRLGRTFRVPRYDFATHTRLARGDRHRPQAVTIVEGLWLWRRPSFRQLFDLRIFVDCPVRVRLVRRLARDAAERGRSRDSARRQFWKTVAPMHDRYVAPQAAWADILLRKSPGSAQVKQLADHVRALKEERN